MFFCVYHGVRHDRRAAYCIRSISDRLLWIIRRIRNGNKGWLYQTWQAGGARLYSMTHSLPYACVPKWGGRQQPNQKESGSEKGSPQAGRGGAGGLRCPPKPCFSEGEGETAAVCHPQIPTGVILCCEWIDP